MACKSLNPEGSLGENSSRKALFEYAGQGNSKSSETHSDKIPVGVKIKFKVDLGVSKLVDYSLLELPIEKAASCDNGPLDSHWATARNGGHHEVITLFCNCGALSNLDLITRKPLLSGAEITGVKITCQRVLTY